MCGVDSDISCRLRHCRPIHSVTCPTCSDFQGRMRNFWVSVSKACAVSRAGGFCLTTIVNVKLSFEQCSDKRSMRAWARSDHWADLPLEVICTSNDFSLDVGGASAGKSCADKAPRFCIPRPLRLHSRGKPSAHNQPWVVLQPRQGLSSSIDCYCSCLSAGTKVTAKTWFAKLAALYVYEACALVVGWLVGRL